ILRGEFVQFDAAKNDALMRQTTLEWPHAFARCTCSADEFLATYASNHIHAVYGDWVAELQAVAEMLGINPGCMGPGEQGPVSSPRDGSGGYAMNTSSRTHRSVWGVRVRQPANEFAWHERGA